MAFVCHESQKIDMNASQSFFVPMVEDLPETEFKPKKKNTPKYLPGEKLLISIHKKKKSKKNPMQKLDIDRLATSLARII